MCLRNIFKTYSDNKENPKKETQSHKRVKHQRFTWFNNSLYPWQQWKLSFTKHRISRVVKKMNQVMKIHN